MLKVIIVQVKFISLSSSNIFRGELSIVDYVVVLFCQYNSNVTVNTEHSFCSCNFNLCFRP